MPEIVVYEENGTDASGMDYSKVTPLLVEALNALREEKDAEIAELLVRLEALEARVSNPSINGAGYIYPFVPSRVDYGPNAHFSD